MQQKDLIGDEKLVAACGLYCGACHKFLTGKCPGCKENEKASWCKIRTCCREQGYLSCADCRLVKLEECRKFNHFIGKILELIFRSDRSACVRRISECGYSVYAGEMSAKRKQTIKKGEIN